MHAPTALAAAPAAWDETSTLVVLMLLFALGAVVALVWAGRERRQRLAAEQRLGAAFAQHRQRQDQIDQRDAAMAEQHRRLNDLNITKLTAEVAWLQAQVQSSASSADRMEAGKEYHELMVEKTKLEMDSLRLHIAEQRRRLEDWRVDNE